MAGSALNRQNLLRSPCINLHQVCTLGTLSSFYRTYVFVSTSCHSHTHNGRGYCPTDAVNERTYNLACTALRFTV